MSETSDGRGLRLLLLHPTHEAICTAARDHADMIAAVHPQTFHLDYQAILRAGGRDAVEGQVLSFVDAHRINAVYLPSLFDVEFRLEFLEDLRRRVFLAMGVDDVTVYFDRLLKFTSQVFDMIVCHDYVETYRFQLYGIPAYFHPMVSNIRELCEREPDMAEKDIDVSHVGRMDRIGRREYLEALQRASIPCAVYGAGTAHGVVTTQKKIDVLFRTKIGLNFSGRAEWLRHSLAPAIDSKVRQVKGRVWELALSKALVLTETAPCLDASFEIGREIEVFETPDEMVDKVRYYMSHENALAEMALAGYRRAWRDVAAIDAARRLVDMLDTRRQQKAYRRRPIRTDIVHRQYMSDRHAELAADHFCDGRLNLAMREAGRMAGISWRPWRPAIAFARRAVRRLIRD